MTFDEPGLVANAGLLLVATLVKRLDLEALVDTMVRFPSKLGGFDHPPAGMDTSDRRYPCQQ